MTATADPSGAPPAFGAARELEAWLGDPRDPGAPLSFRSTIEADEREEFPIEATRLLDARGFAWQFVPAVDGGKLRGWDELVMLVRCLARRDMTIAFAYGSTLLGSLPVWLWVTSAQRRRLVDLYERGAGLGSFALSEEQRGSDLLACDAVAAHDREGYRLTGRKWPIGNANRGKFFTVLARTDPGAGALAYSLFFVEKSRLAEGSFECLPKIRTHGVRGHDLSGVRFAEARLEADALLDREGRGIEQTLKTLQFTRTVISSVSLGAADTCLRIAADWAVRRELYGRSILELPTIRDAVLGSFVDLVIAECVALAASRGLTACPERMSIWSSVTKYLVPLLAERVVRQTISIVGARHYLREGLGDGILQKIIRDHSIMGVFEGSAEVNLHAIACQLHDLLPGLANTADYRCAAVLEAVFRFHLRCPDWVPDQARLQVTNSGLDEIASGWGVSVARARSSSTRRATSSSAEVLDLLALVEAQRGALVASARPSSEGARTLQPSLHDYDLARRYCWLHAAACCVHAWTHNRDAMTPLFVDGAWLVLCLRRILAELDRPIASPTHASELTLDYVMRCSRDNALFSLMPLALGRGTT